MFAESWFAVASHLGWLGIAAFLLTLVAHFALTHSGARWIFGPTPSRGGRLLLGLSTAAVFAAVGGIARCCLLEFDGSVHKRWEQVGYGAGYGLALSFWVILLSLRRAETREPL